MDGILAIRHNHDALKRILASLFAMAGLATAPHPEVRSLSGSEGEPRRTLPRYLRLAVLRLLRPAEAAARRLVIALALTAMPEARASGTVPSQRPHMQNRKPKPRPTILRNGIGTGIVLPRGLPGTAALRPAARPLGFPLFDPLRRPFGRPRRPAASGVPRICFPGFSQPFPVPVRQPSAPDDMVDAVRLGQRLAALGRALDDLPAQARRFIRWHSRVAAGAQDRKQVVAAGAQDRKQFVAAGAQNPGQRGKALGYGRVSRIWPLRMGRPPGGRLSRYDPIADRRRGAAGAHRSKRGVREVDEVLAHTHALAVWALEQKPDTS